MEVALSRVSKRPSMDRSENIATLTKAKEDYEYTIKLFKNVFRIDATLSEEECFSEIKKKIRVK